MFVCAFLNTKHFTRTLQSDFANKIILRSTHQPSISSCLNIIRSCLFSKQELINLITITPKMRSFLWLSSEACPVWNETMKSNTQRPARAATRVPLKQQKRGWSITRGGLLSYARAAKNRPRSGSRIRRVSYGRSGEYPTTGPGIRLPQGNVKMAPYWLQNTVTLKEG